MCKFLAFPLKILWRPQHKTSDNFNKNLCFDTILSEHESESRSINPFNRFPTIYFVTSTGEQQIIVILPDMPTHQNG